MRLNPVQCTRAVTAAPARMSAGMRVATIPEVTGSWSRAHPSPIARRRGLSSGEVRRTRPSDDTAPQSAPCQTLSAVSKLDLGVAGDAPAVAVPEGVDRLGLRASKAVVEDRAGPAVPVGERVDVLVVLEPHDALAPAALGPQPALATTALDLILLSPLLVRKKSEVGLRHPTPPTL